MKIVFFLLKSILLCQIVMAQTNSNENLYPIQNEKQKISFINKSGKVIYELDSIESQIATNSSYKKGKLYLNKLKPLSVKVYDNHGKSLIFTEGIGLFSPFITPFEYGYCVVSNNKGGYGIIDTDGNLLFPLNTINKNLIECGDGIFARKVKGIIEFIEPEGKLLFTKPEDECEGEVYNYRFKCGLSVYTKDAKVISTSTWSDTKYYSGGKKGYMDKEGNQVIAPIFEKAYPFNEGFAFVGGTSSEKYWFIDKNGNNVFGKEFGWTSLGNSIPPHFSGGLANVKDLGSNKAGYIDTLGKWVIEPIYSNISPFSNGLGMGFTADNKTKIFKKDGTVIIEGYWGNTPWDNWWDDNLIYIGYLGTYFNHKGQKVWSKKYPFIFINSIEDLKRIESPELVKSIYISSDVKEIPSQVYLCKNLEALALSNLSSPLTTLPKEIYGLTKLKKLNLNMKYLKTVPKGIGKLQNLEEIQINYSQINKLPKDFIKLIKLKRVDLNSNMLTTLPSGFEKLKNIIELNTDFNPIEKLPEGIFSLPKLASFSFRKNYFLNNETIIKELVKAYPTASLTTRVGLKTTKPNNNPTTQPNNFNLLLIEVKKIDFKKNYDSELTKIQYSSQSEMKKYFNKAKVNEMYFVFKNLIESKEVPNFDETQNFKTNLKKYKNFVDSIEVAKNVLKIAAKNLYSKHKKEIKVLNSTMNKYGQILGFEEDNPIDNSKPTSLEEAFGDEISMMSISSEPTPLAPMSEKIEDVKSEKKENNNSEKTHYIPDEEFKNLTNYYKAKSKYNQSMIEGGISKGILDSDDNLFNNIENIEIENQKIFSYIFSMGNKLSKKELISKIENSISKKVSEKLTELYKK